MPRAEVSPPGPRRVGSPPTRETRPQATAPAPGVKGMPLEPPTGPLTGVCDQGCGRQGNGAPENSTPFRSLDKRDPAIRTGDVGIPSPWQRCGVDAAACPEETAGAEAQPRPPPRSCCPPSWGCHLSTTATPRVKGWPWPRPGAAGALLPARENQRCCANRAEAPAEVGARPVPLPGKRGNATRARADSAGRNAQEARQAANAARTGIRRSGLQEAPEAGRAVRPGQATGS
jgi:hypothetical protein